MLRFNGREIPIETGKTVFEHADRGGQTLPHSCRRRGTCHECIVEVKHGAEALSARTEQEKFLRGRFRLACQCRVERDDLDIQLHALRRGAPQILAGGRHSACALEPAVRRGTGEQAGWVLIDGAPAAQLETADRPILGLAADLGTTTVVLRLIDLESGALLASHSFENPQIIAAGDVMGRIGYDREDPGHELQKILVRYINESILELTRGVKCKPTDIYEFVAAGNATMRDLFFKLDVQGIGQRPFQSLTEKAWRAGERATTAITAAPARLGLKIHKQGRVYGVPLIACHVGADTAACLAAIELDREEKIVIMMDIGTNTELVLGNRERAICASCPAGPAFEGGQIACGMPGLEGAIETIRLNGEVEYKTIGDAPAMGVCGSGLVDALGELTRTGRINMLGRLEGAGGEPFWIDRARDLYLSEHDISMLAQAKAANIAGILILLEQYGITIEQVDRFYLAGGFASYIDLEQAVRIGMIPRMPLEKIEKIGNASIEGATMILRSTDVRARIETLVTEVEHVELEQHPHFFSIFVEGCQFKTSGEMVESLGA